MSRVETVETENIQSKCCFSLLPLEADCCSKRYFCSTVIKHQVNLEEKGSLTELKRCFRSIENHRNMPHIGVSLLFLCSLPPAILCGRPFFMFVIVLFH